MVFKVFKGKHSIILLSLLVINYVISFVMALEDTASKMDNFSHTSCIGTEKGRFKRDPPPLNSQFSPTQPTPRVPPIPLPLPPIPPPPALAVRPRPTFPTPSAARTRSPSQATPRPNHQLKGQNYGPNHERNSESFLASQRRNKSLNPGIKRG